MDLVYQKILALLGEDKRSRKEVNQRFGRGIVFKKSETLELMKDLKKRNFIEADKRYCFIKINGEVHRKNTGV